MMRIITGSARGIKLETLGGVATRPTAERVKEAVFSMLQFSLEGRRVLDLFAGSGQLGLEAVSRGAEKAVLVDAARDAIGVITKNATRTKLAAKTEILQRDAIAYLSSGAVNPFHLVFLDPPYAAGLVPQCLSLLIARGWLTAGALIVAETKDEADVFDGKEELFAHFEILKKSRYGAAHITILAKREIDI